MTATQIHITPHVRKTEIKVVRHPDVHPRITRLEHELAAAKKPAERMVIIRELAKARRIFA